MTRFARLLSGTAVALVLSLGIPAYADMQAGLDAYGKGDYPTALAEWTEAAVGGDMQAAYFVGNMYANGEGMEEPDHETALYYFELAAESGHVEAMISAASLYRVGPGKVAQNYRKAVDWLYKAAESKHPVAQMDLGDVFMMQDEEDVTYAPGHSFEWYRLAAKQGVLLGQFKLGQMYLEGVGTERDAVRGFMWLTIAARLVEEGGEPDFSARIMSMNDVVPGDKDQRTLGVFIKETRDDYAKTMTTLQLEEAEALAREYSPGQH